MSEQEKQNNSQNGTKRKKLATKIFTRVALGSVILALLNMVAGIGLYTASLLDVYRREGYSLASVVYEMLRRLLSRLVAVSHNAREEFWQTCTGEENQRDAHVVKFPEMGVVNGVLCQAGYDALNVHAHEIVYSELLTVVVLMAVSADYRVA